MMMTPEFEDALFVGEKLGITGHYPTIYKLSPYGYAVAKEREWPPAGSYPAFKWTGDDWLLIPLRLSNLDVTLDVCDYFRSKGYDVIAVEFCGITYDIFLDESFVPEGAWVIQDDNYEDELILSQWSVLYQ